MTCPHCAGTGMAADNECECEECGGTGLPPPANDNPVDFDTDNIGGLH